MRKVIVLGLIALLGACFGGTTKQELGLANTAPDESVVETRQPLSLPPEFDVRPSVVKNTAGE